MKNFKDKNNFDIIFLNDVYEHVEDPKPFTVLRNSKTCRYIFIDTRDNFGSILFLNIYLNQFTEK